MRLLKSLSCVLGILFVVQNINAVPTGNRVTSCSRLECPKFSKFRYATGKTYSYKYEVDVASVVDGVSGAQESRIHLMAKVHFDVNTLCDWTLRVSDVTLQDSEPHDAARKSSVPGEMAFKEALENSDLPFTFHDGVVPHICPSTDEPVWSVNIKRGILSAFQNNMARLDLDYETLENDVAGVCKVNYVFYGAVQNTINVLKTRDLSSCTNRYGLSDSLSSVQYRFLGAAADHIQLTNSSGSCQQTIAANRITQIECDEKHVVRPFSHEGSGATTNVRQSLVFVEDVAIENNENGDSTKKKDQSRRKSSLIYQHVKSKDGSSSGADSVLTLPSTLQRLCQNTEEGVGNEAAAAFGRLVRTMKTMDYPSLGELMSEAATMCRDGEAARQHLLNGLISAATSEAVSAMNDEVITGKVDPALISQWIASLAFIPRPTEKHLKAALPLLDMPSISRQASLSISSLARKLCIGGCSSEVHLLVGKLSKQLGNSCQTRSRDEREEIIVALKSLANIGEAISGDHIDTVKNCFREKDNSAEVRVEALKVFRSIPCHIRGNAAMKILEDNSEDSEIRIAAYLGVMKCPNYQTILDIKDLLNNEEINQVGSFIWTHLKNLATSSLPTKLNVQGLILDQMLVQKFDTDGRKFSRNYEKSILIDHYNTAASLESNVIFSQHSYLPRSTSLNLTVDIFGQSVNLLEFDGRFEGFEHYIESLFGPGGPYQQKEVGYLLESLRSKRKINAPKLNAVKLSMMDKQFDAGSRFSDEPEMSLSMKIFGNEIGYGHWEGRKEVLNWVQGLSPTTKLHNLMNGEEKQFSYATEYIDSTHVIPLSVGLPLNLMARGQVVADFRGNMRTDLKSILSKGKGEIIWKAHPSASVNFNGAMIVDAVAIKAGVTLEASLHSSISTSGKFALDGLRLFDLQIDLPQEKAEIITFKSDIILQHRTLKTPLTGIEENRVDTSDCTRGLTQRYLGLQICSQATYPNASQNEFAPNFPLTGPSHFSLSLDKADPSIKSYRFLHKIENKETLKSWVLTFRPEGLKESKEIGLKTKIEFKESDSGLLEFGLMLPSNSYETKGTFKWKEATKAFEASFMRDKKEQLLVAKASLDRSLCSKPSEVCFQPKLSLTLSDRKLVDLGGEIKLTEKKGTYRYEVNLNSTLNSLTTVSKGYYLVDEKSHLCNLTVDYASSPKGRRESLKIEIKVNKENSSTLSQYDVQLEVVPTAYPQRNFVGTWRLQRRLGHFENVVTMNIGPVPRDNRNSLTIHQGLSYSVGLSPQNLKLKSHFEMTLPAKGLNVAFIIGHEQTDYKTDSLLVGRYGPGKEIQCGILFHKKPSVLFQASGAFNLTLPAQPVIRFNGVIQEETRNNYKVDLDGVWGQDTDFQLNSNYQNQIKSSNSIQQLSVAVTGSNIYPTEFVYTFQTNHTALEVQVQSSYGKDAVSLYLSNEKPTKEELKVVTKVGYLTYLHTVEAYWKELSDGQKGTFDAHIDKVIDVRGDVTMDVASDGRRDFSLDIQWDPNRNPLQKLSVKTSFEPSILNPNDWKSAVILSYPGSFIRGNIAALTQKNNRSLSGTIDLGSRRNINFVASTIQSRNGLTSEVIIETPFIGWQHNKAIFTSETKELRHKTQFLTKYGPSRFFEIGLDARIEIVAELRTAEVSLGWKSSSSRLEDFQITAKAELQPKVLDNTIKIKWGKGQEVGLASNLEWSFDGQVMIKNEISLTSTFPQLSQVKFEIYHNTEWEIAEIFETRGLLVIDQQKYTVLLKGENPSHTKRWEFSAIITTPNANYSRIGVSSQYTVDDKHPSFDLHLNWPGKELGVKLLTDIMTEGFYRGRLEMKTPFEQFHHLAIDGSCTSPSDLSIFKLDLGTRWNVEDFMTFNATWDVESFINSDIIVDLKTSFPGNENYGSRLKLNLDLAEYSTASSELVVKFPSTQVGFSVNGTMTEAEGGFLIDITVALDVADFPRVLVSITHETKGPMDFKTTTVFSRGNKSFGLSGLATTTDEGYFLASLNLTTPLTQLSEIAVRMRFLNNVIDDANTKMIYEAGLKWKEFNEENKIGGRLSYETSLETLEDFNERSSTAFELTFASPWEMVQRLSLKGKQVNENSAIIPMLEAVFNNQSLTLNGKVDFIESVANIVLAKKTTTQAKPMTIRMNTTWTLEDEIIKVEGTVVTGIPGFSRIPWNLEITFIDDENDENVWERLIKGEARLSTSTSILLNAAYLPTKLNANMITPFQSLKNLNLTVDFEKSTDSATAINGEFRINNDQMEFTTNVDWPQDSTLPLSAEISLNMPFEYELLSLTWASEDPKSAAELSLTWNKKNQPNNFQTRYDFSAPGKLITEVKLDRTIDSDLEQWAFKLNSEYSPQKLSGFLSFATPLNQFKSGEISGLLDDKIRNISVILDTQAITGKLLISTIRNDQGVMAVDTTLEILQYCNLKIKFNVDRTYSHLDLDVFAVWDPTLVQWGIKTKIKRNGWRKYDWNSALSSDSNRKWLLDLNLDFEQVTTAYSHKIRYEAVHDSVLYNTYGSYYLSSVEYKGQLGFDWGAGKPFEIKFANKKVAKKLGNSVIEIITPWSEESLAVIDITADARENPVEFKITSEIADRNVIVSMNIKYNSLVSMAAKTIVTTTYTWMPRAALDLNTRSERDSFNGSYGLEWSNNNLDLHVFRQETDGASVKEKNLRGAVQIKTSWNKLPEASVRYSRSFTNPTAVESRVQINHNSTELINVLYKCNDKSSAGQELNQGQLEFRGTLFSGGLAFSRLYKYSGGQDGDNLPRSLNRTLDVYEIGKRSKFTLRIEFLEMETLTGQEYVLKLSSPFRTIEFLTRSDFPDGVFRHGSEFRWRPDAKIAYEIEIENKTTATAADYVMTTSLMTPVRNIGLTGTMRQTKRNLRAVAEVVWDLKRRDSVVKVIVTWDNTTKTRDVDVNRLKIGFSQGNLPQELALVTEIRRSAAHPLNMRTEVQYSKEPQRKLIIDNIVTARPGNYRYEMNMTHEATKLEIRQVFSYERNITGRTRLEHLFSHSRADAESFAFEHLLMLDQQEKRIIFSASSPVMTLRHLGQLKQSGNTSYLTYEIQQDDSITKTAELILRRNLPYANLVMKYDLQNMKGLYMNAGMQDKRQIVLECFNMDNQDRIPFFDFAFRLNHSRLVTSKTNWQIDWRSRLIQGIGRTRDSLSLTADRWVSGFLLGSSETAGSMLNIGEDIILVLDTAWSNFIDEIDKLQGDINVMKQNIIDGYYADAFFARIAVQIGGAIIQDIPFGSYAQSFVAFIEKTGDRILAPFTEETDSFSRWLRSLGPYFTSLSETITSWIGEQWNWPTEGSSKVMEEFGQAFRKIAEEYNHFIEQFQKSFWESLPDVWVPLRGLIKDSWNDIYQVLRPVLVRNFVAIESAVWNVMKDVLDFLYKHQEAVVESSYFQKLSLLVEDIKQFYLDMQSTDWPSKIKKYLTQAGHFMQQKYSDIDDYLTWLAKLRAEIGVIYQEFLKENPELQKGAENWQKFLAFIQWTYNHLDVNQKISDIIVVMRERGEEILRQTATDAQMRYSLQKTLFHFNPDLGSIELEQKLPFPWLSLDETPQFDQLPEIQKVKSILAMFKSSNTSAVDTVLSYIPSHQPLTQMLPPFKSSAHLVGLQHFVTFDGRHFDFVGPCTYLLARDFLTKNFTLAVQYISSRGKPYATVLQLVIDDAQWDLDLANRTVRVAGVNRILPTEERGTAAYYQDGKFVINSPKKGVHLQCIAAYDACTLTLSGWYHNKIAGLMGTMDNEPTNDLITPNRVIELDLTSLAQSWDVSAKDDCKTVENMARNIVSPDDKLSETCSSFFQSQRSTLKNCLTVIDPAPYLSMCLIRTRSRANDQDGCHAAAAYASACAAKGVVLRIPPQCIRCQMENESLSEGDEREINAVSLNRISTDVVVLLELKKCNEPEGSSRRFLSSLINSLEKELSAHKILKNRYSLVVFGGKAPYDTPKIRTLNGQEFVNAKDVDNLLQNLSYANGPDGVLDAVRFASQLSFRPGVSKTFVLLPCSSCESIHDHETTSQSLLEQDATLHVLTDAEFRFIKPNVSRQFLGLDANTGFTPKEIKGRLIGDADLRRQARLPKSLLGICAPVALQTNGTIFAVSRLREQRKNSSEGKRAVNVWVKRVAFTARATNCQKCTCNLKNYYESALDCRMCIPRELPIVDTSFLVEENALPKSGKTGRSRSREEVPN